MVGIYKIANIINGKVYIGQSINIKQRFAQHKSAAFNKNDTVYEYPLYRAIRKYGLENFSFEVLEKCKKEELNDKEKFYIAKYQAHGCGGYNQDDGGSDSTHNRKLTESDVASIIERLKMSTDTTFAIATEFNVGETTIKNINRGLAYHQDNENYPIRPKLWLLMSTEDGTYQIKNKEKPCPICGKSILLDRKTCNNCRSITQRKVLMRPEPLMLAQMVKEHGFENVGMQYGVTDNTIKSWCKDYNMPCHKQELIDWYNKQMKINDMKTKKPYKKPVKQIDMKTGAVINIFESARDAARNLGVKNCSHITEVCMGKNKSAYGYFWEYTQLPSLTPK